MVAYVGREELPLQPLVFGGSHPLAEQAWAPRELLQGTVNVDGWGVVWYHGGRPVRLARPEPVWHDTDLPDVLASLRARTAVAALRNATPGLPVDAASVLPLRLDRWAFVLNGFVPDFRSRWMRTLRAALPERLYRRLRTMSDAETLFLLAVSRLEAGAGPGEALGWTVEHVLELVGPDGPETHLTALLTDGETVAVTRSSNRGEVNSLYWIRSGSLAPHGTLLASEALDHEEGWTPVPERRVAEFGPDGMRDGG